MSRYIDAEWLKAEFPHNEDWNYPVNTNSYVVGMIDEAPHIDIVRCKECRFGQWHEQAEEYICIAHDQDLFDAEHFCSYGEREGE